MKNLNLKLTALAALAISSLTTRGAIEITPDHVVSGAVTGNLIAIDVPFVPQGTAGGPTWTTGGGVVASAADQGFTTRANPIQDYIPDQLLWEPDGTPASEAGSWITYNAGAPSVSWNFDPATSGIAIPDGSTINAVYAVWFGRRANGATYEYTEGAASGSNLRPQSSSSAGDLVLKWTDDVGTVRNANFERIFTGPIVVEGGDGFELLAYENVQNTAHIDAVVIDFTPFTGGPPTIVSTSPEDNAVDVLPKSDLVVRFSEDVALTGSGSITLRHLGSGQDRVIDLSAADPDGSATISGTYLTIDLAADLDYVTDYAVQISADAIQDFDATPKPFTGITDDTTWNFTSSPPDTAQPVVTELSPVDDLRGASPWATLVATFNEPVSLKDGGTITITDLTDGSSSQVITLPDGRVTSPNGDEVSIDLATDLELATDYSVRISSNAVEDQAEIPNGFSGIADDTTWNFRTLTTVHNIMLVTLELADQLPNQTIDQAEAIMFHNLENVDAAMRVASYGQVGLHLGDGSGMDPTVEMKYLDTYTADTSPNTLRLRAAGDLAAMGYNLNNYRFILYAAPPDFPGGTAGAASLGGQWSTYRVFNLGVVMHELGHCLGGNHSFQDPGCALGWGAVNYAADKKVRFGWMDAYPGTVVDVTDDTTLTMVPLGEDPATLPGIRVVQVPRPDGLVYSIAYQVSEDPYRRLFEPETYSQEVFVTLDMGGTLTSHRATLAAGESFTWEFVTVTCDSVAVDGQSAEVSIAFNEPEVNFNPGVDSGVEGTVSTATATVELSRAFPQPVVVDHQLAASAGTAQNGIDYNYTPGTLTFNPGETTKTFTFDIVDNLIEDGNRTINFDLNVVSNGIPGADTTFTYTIVNEDGNFAPTWNSDPVAELGVSVGSAYATTLADDASDGNGNPLTFAKVAGPAWLVVGADGTLSGSPTVDDLGANVFTVSVSDGIAAAVSATLNITVNPNNAPTFTIDPITGSDATEDAAYAGTIAGAASDADGDALTYAKASGPAWLAVAADGTLSGVPSQADVGASVFTVSASDGVNPAVQATLNITVINVNDAPVFVSDPVNAGDATKDEPYTGTLAGSASDEDGDTLTYAKVSGPAWLSVAPNGDFTGTPTNSDVGVNAFIVSVSDGTASPVQASLNIDVTVPSTPTVAYWQFDSSSGSPGLADSVGSYGLSVVGGAFTASTTAAVDPISNPDFTSGFTGDPSANPDTGLSHASLLAPGTAAQDRLTVSGDPGNVFNLAGKEFTFEGWIQQNGSTPDGFGDMIGGTRLGSPWGGYILRMTPTGNINAYFNDSSTSWSVSTSDTNYIGTDFIHFALVWQDGAGDNSTGLAKIYIDGELKATASAPAGWNSALSDSKDLDFGLAGRANNGNTWDGQFDEFRFSSAALTPSEFLVNLASNALPVFAADPIAGADATEDAAYVSSIAGSASDADGDTLTYTKVTGPAWLSVAPNGDLTGTPANSDVGANVFTVSVSDGTAAPVEAALTITVINVNDAPVFTADPIAGADATEDVLYVGTIVGSASDDDGDTLTFAKVNGPAWLSVAPNGDLTGTPTNSDVGANIFTVNVSDGTAAPVEATLNISVINVNEPPVFVSDPIAGADATQDFAYTGSIAGSASDTDGDALTYAKVSGLTWLSVAPNGDLTGTPRNSDVGANVFIVSVSDGTAAPVEAALTITVINVNDAPVFTAAPIASADATEDVAYVGTIAGSASDADGDALSYAKVSGPAWLSVAPNGDLIGTPTNSDVGANVFTVSVSDGTAAAVEAGLTITVINVNDAPVFTADPIAGGDATEDAAYTGTIAGSASDDEDDALSYAKVSGPAWLSVAPNGDLTGTPTNSDVGANVFTVSVSDGTATPVNAALNITVINVNDAPVFTADPIAGVDATEDAAYTGTIAGSASDDEGDTLTYAKVGGPAWLSVAPNGDLTGTPTNSDVGANVFTVSVSDGVASPVQASLNINVTVPSSATVAYWQFDSSSSSPGLADSVGSYGLSIVGGAFTASTTAAANPIWNPDFTSGFTGDPSANPDAGLSHASLLAPGTAGQDRLTVSSDSGDVFNLAGKEFTFEGWIQHNGSTPEGFGDMIGGTRLGSPWGGYILRLTADGDISAYITDGTISWGLATSGTNYIGTDFIHFALVWQDGAGDNSTGLAKLYIDGELKATASAPAGWSAATADSKDLNFGLAGRANNGNTWDGQFDEFRFSSAALSPSEFLMNTSNVAPVFSADPIAGADATEDAAYVASIAGSASDDDGDTLTYVKVSGPAWLSVAPNGDLTGTPANNDVGANAFTVGVSDGTAVAVEAGLTITVINVNDAPVFAADPIAGADATEDAAYVGSIAGSASDADGDALTYAKVSGPAWLSVAPNGDLAGTPTNSDVGANVFTVSVSDGTAVAVEAGLTITVINVNDAPVFAADPIAGADATQDFAYTGSISGSASDADGDALSYAKVSGLTWLSVAPNGDLTGTPRNSDVGANVFIVSVSDGTAAPVEAALTITVINVNDAPIFIADPIVGADATEDAAYVGSIAGSASDADGDALSYAKVSGPAWLSVAPNGDLVGTPTNSDVGANAFTVSVSDGMATPVNAALNITVINVNDAPVFASDPIAGADATEDAAYVGTIAGSASDDDGDTLTYAKLSGPAWLSVAPNGDLTGTPENSDVGANAFTVSVSDGTAVAVEAGLTITVINVNDAPVFAADPIAGADATEDAAYVGTIAGSASDADGDTLTYAKLSGPAWLSVAPNGDLTGTPENSDVGANAFTVSVSDGTAVAVEAGLTITVINVNDAPVFAVDPIAGVDATEDAAYVGTIAGSASDDDGDTLTYAKLSGPAWLSVAPNGDLTGTPENSDVGANAFTVSVSDGTAVAVEAGLTITVINVNDAPVFASDPIAGADATEDAAYVGTIAGSASDDDGDTLTYAKVSGPAWLSVAPNGDLTGTPANSDVGANAFTISVSDGTAVAVEATLNITVNENLVAVPDVVGLAQATAESSIVSAELTVGTVTSQHDELVPAGDVISQGLTPGADVPAGSAVDLVVSLGVDASPKLVRTTVTAVSNASWTSVDLGQTYTSPVIVATPIYPNSTLPPVVTRITNVTATGFDLKIDRADGLTDPVSIDVSIVVVDEGVYTQAVDGVTMEAVKFTSTVTGGKSSWVAEARTFQNTYTNPVIVGQVMSANDPNWSVFWSMGSSRTSPVDASNLNVGKHVGEDPNSARADETIGYIIIESGSGTIDGVAYEAGLGSDSLRGFGNSSNPYTYNLSGGLPSVGAAAASISGMDGPDGSWAVLSGNPALTTTSIGLHACEDQLKDSEQSHTTTQAGYIVFE